MSRPLSRKGSAKGGKNAKPKKKTPKQQIAELTEQNETLTKELESLKTEASGMKDKIDAVTLKLVSSIRKHEFGIADDTDLHTIPIPTLVDIIENLVVKKQIYDVSVESRVTELESRLTSMTMEVAKMTTKTAAYETGLECLGQCSNLQEVTDKIYQLQLIAGQEYHTFSSNDPEKTPRDILNGYHDNKPNSATHRTLHNAHLLNLTAPSKKLPGETHIKSMHKDLRLHVIQELSPEKASGSDWRRFAERVGIDEQTRADWKSQKLKYPMSHVMKTWETSASASTRMLHRHLMSPQMRCTLVAKRVSDFYNVD